MALHLSIGKPSMQLSDDPGDSASQVHVAEAARQAGQLETAAYQAQLKAIAAQFPTCLSAWAALGELALPDDAVTAYAFFRTGYHRGLDRARAVGWNGSQQLPWEQVGNRGFLRCLHGLMSAAMAIGEASEATRTQQFLLELDSANHFGLERSAQ